MWETWRATLSAWTDFRSIPDEITAFGDKVLVMQPHRRARQGERRRRERGHGHSCGRCEDGKVVRMALYWDVDSARREAEAQD